MSSALQFEILDLRHFSANSLRPVLEQESRVWAELLRWDYRSSAELLLQYLDSRVLPGFVAIDGGRIAGYVFCVYEGPKAVIGDVFASRSASPSPVDVELRLLEYIMELLQNSPGVERIESQLLLHPHGVHGRIFEQAGFRTYRRLFLDLDLKAAPPARTAALPPELEMRPWQEGDFAPAGKLIAASYEGHLDSHINDQYRTVAGSLRFLHNIVRFPGCGVFDPGSSRIIVQRQTGEMVALLLCSRVRSDVGHVTQICVTPPWRRHGLATLLLDACSGELRRRGFTALTLTVTEENCNAVSLYLSRGFRERHAFDAMVWERQDRHKR